MTDTTNETPAAAPAATPADQPRPNTAVVQLDEPIQRGEQTIASVTLRRPVTRDLRGINLADLVQMKTDAIAAVLPRISNPTLLQHEIDLITPADLISLAGEVVLFFAPKQATEATPSPAA